MKKHSWLREATLFKEIIKIANFIKAFSLNKRKIDLQFQNKNNKVCSKFIWGKVLSKSWPLKTKRKNSGRVGTCKGKKLPLNKLSKQKIFPEIYQTSPKLNVYNILAAQRKASSHNFCKTKRSQIFILMKLSNSKPDFSKSSIRRPKSIILGSQLFKLIRIWKALRQYFGNYLCFSCTKNFIKKGWIFPKKWAHSRPRYL